MYLEIEWVSTDSKPEDFWPRWSGKKRNGILSFIAHFHVSSVIARTLSIKLSAIIIIIIIFLHDYFTTWALSSKFYWARCSEMTFIWKSSEMNCKRKHRRKKKCRKVLFAALKKPLITFLRKIFKPYILVVHLLGMFHLWDRILFILWMPHPFRGWQLSEHKWAFLSGKMEGRYYFILSVFHWSSAFVVLSVAQWSHSDVKSKFW